MRARCGHCKKVVREYYMIHDDLWKSLPAHLHDKQLHFACVEELIGRKLVWQDLKPIPLNTVHIADREGPVDPLRPSMKMRRWNLAHASKAKFDGHTLAIGTEVRATKNYDPEGADVKRGDRGYVLLETNAYGGGVGPLVHWIGGGMCSVYPHMCLGMWCDDTVELMRRKEKVHGT